MTRGVAEIHADIEATSAAITRIATRSRAATTTAEDHAWAAMTLATDAATCTSILSGLPVRVGNLDATQLFRALRGATPPHTDGYVVVTPEMLQAVIEAGPLEDTWADIPEHIRPDAPTTPDNVVEIGSQPPRILPPRTWIPR